MLCVALCGIGAARVPAAEPAALCIPLLTPCGSQPTPSPTPKPSPIIPLPLGPGTLPGAGSAPTPPPVVAVPDAGAPTFTLPAAQLGGSSISIVGLKSVTVVTVPLANGSRTPVLKIMADDVTVDDFLLDVRKATGPSLVTTATRMALHGNVQIYLDSLTATTLDGLGITLGAATPPPGGELPSQLMRVNLGLVGVTANSIVFTAPHQDLKE
jgi:hypothetical protein